MSANSEFSYQLREMVENELNEEEQILWGGQPAPKRLAAKKLPLFFFAIPWTAFSLFWMYAASGFSVPFSGDGFSLFSLFGIPFLLIGIAMLSTPLWAMRNAKRTVYILTNRRAVIFAGGFNTTISSYSPGQLYSTTRKQNPDGSGDILFNTEINSLVKNKNINTLDPGFYGIKNVKEVEKLIKKLIGESS